MVKSSAPLRHGQRPAAHGGLRPWAALAVAGLLAAMVSDAVAQPPSPAANAPAVATWRLSATNVMRLESWRYFEPRPGGGDPDYAFLADRLRVDVRGHWARVDLTLAAQYVGMAGLPGRAVGPGALGTGALYFEQGSRASNASQIYLRFANLRVPAVVPGVDLQIGRMGYLSGAEAPSGVAKIETVKRQRLDARLVGEFEWSIYQRAFDGVRVDVTRPRWRATGVAFMPARAPRSDSASTCAGSISRLPQTFGTPAAAPRSPAAPSSATPAGGRTAARAWARRWKPRPTTRSRRASR